LPTAAWDRVDAGAPALGWQSDRDRHGAESGLARPGWPRLVRWAVRSVGSSGRGCDRAVAGGAALRRACAAVRP
jgi:hypothetical protein